MFAFSRTWMAVFSVTLLTVSTKYSTPILPTWMAITSVFTLNTLFTMLMGTHMRPMQGRANTATLGAG